MRSASLIVASSGSRKQRVEGSAADAGAEERRRRLERALAVGRAGRRTKLQSPLGVGDQPLELLGLAVGERELRREIRGRRGAQPGAAFRGRGRSQDEEVAEDDAADVRL